MNSLIARLLTDIPLIHPPVVQSWWVEDPNRTAAAKAFGEAIGMLLRDNAADDVVAESPFKRAIRAMVKPEMTVDARGFATIPVHGPMAYSPDAFEMLFHGLTDSRDVLEMVERARTDPGIRGAMLDINSPGGMVTGGVEVAERVGEMRRAKPVVAHIGGLGASLAYWIASQANAVTISPGASAGSIGAMVPVTDISRALENAGIKVEAIVSEGARYKAGGMPGTSLSESAREQLQERVNAVGKQFRNAVTRTRPGIPEDAMRGQIFGATQAKQLGFADAIGDSRYAMALLRGMAPAGN